MRSTLKFALAAILLTTLPVLAQPDRPVPRPAPRLAAVLERLSRMSPEQRQHALDRLPPNRRAQVEERLNRLNAMPLEARERLREQYDEFQKLPPEKQDAVRRAFRQLNQLPENRRPAIRRTVVRLRDMSPEQRKFRMDSETFRSRFSEEEQRVIRDLADTAPSQGPDRQE